MLETEKLSAKLYFASHFATWAKLRVTCEILCLEDIKCDISSSVPYYIYPHYSQNCKGAIQSKTLKRFL